MKINENEKFCFINYIKKYIFTYLTLFQLTFILIQVNIFMDLFYVDYDNLAGNMQMYVKLLKY